jgi:hypothetical protein
MEDTRPTLTTGQAGRLLAVTHETVRRYWELGLLEGYLMAPGKHGRLRVYRDSVEAFDRQRKGGPVTVQ